MDKFVVYTAITNDYDVLQDIPRSLSHIKFICFTNNRKLQTNGNWQIIFIDDLGLGPIKTAREIKIRPHKYLPSYDYSLWVDGNVRLNDSARSLLEDLVVSESLISMIRHPFRQCIYSEGLECIESKKDDVGVILNWLKLLKFEEYPIDLGLCETNVIFRCHDNPRVIDTMELWWRCVKEYSCRDQLSFNYAIYRKSLCPSFFIGTTRGDNPAFSLMKHGAKHLHTEAISDYQFFLSNREKIYSEDKIKYSRFQDILELSIDEIAKIITPMFISQVFIDIANEFSEENSLSIPIKIDNVEQKKLDYDLSAFNLIKQLRFDPLNERCVVRINSFKLVLEDNSIVGVESHLLSNGIFLENENAYIFNHNDPQLIFDVGTINLSQKIRSLVIEIQYLYCAEAADKYCMEKILDISMDKEKEIAKLHDQISHFEQERSELETKISELQSDNLFLNSEVFRIQQEFGQFKKPKLIRIAAKMEKLRKKYSNSYKKRRDKIRKLFKKNGIPTPMSAPTGYQYIEPSIDVQVLFRNLANMKYRPLFSIVTPVYNTPPELLDELIASVERQWYPDWELILADDCSPNADIRKKLSEIHHPKIKVIFQEKNGGISEATNAAIRAASGEYIVFVDHDDLITIDCLYELALCINQDLPDMIYSDEDKIDEHRHYLQPHFKPDWSPDTLMSLAYICHITCIKKSILDKTGLLNKEVDGAQDWDLTLRVSEVTQNIKHIPKVLYHWRIIPQSTSGSIDAKPYVVAASKRTRELALQRRGLNALIEPLSEAPGQFRVNYLPQGNPLVSIIIPTRDNKTTLQTCIQSILNGTQYQNFEIVVIDNGSINQLTLDYLSEINRLEKVHVFRKDIPFNFSTLCNFGASQSKGDILLFLNDDTEIIQSDWLERMIGYAQLPHVGAVGAQLLYPKEQLIQHAGVLNLPGSGPNHAFCKRDPKKAHYYYRNRIEYNWLAVTGACLMIEREKFKAVGQFDEELSVAYNDVALCFSCVTHGYYNVVCQAVTLYHYESFSRGDDRMDSAKMQRLLKELALLRQKFPMFDRYDPFFNINFHENGVNFELKN